MPPCSSPGRQDRACHVSIPGPVGSCGVIQSPKGCGGRGPGSAPSEPGCSARRTRCLRCQTARLGASTSARSTAPTTTSAIPTNDGHPTIRVYGRFTHGAPSTCGRRGQPAAATHLKRALVACARSLDTGRCCSSKREPFVARPRWCAPGESNRPTSRLRVRCSTVELEAHPHGNRATQVTRGRSGGVRAHPILCARLAYGHRPGVTVTSTVLMVDGLVTSRAPATL